MACNSDGDTGARRGLVGFCQKVQSRPAEPWKIDFLPRGRPSNETATTGTRVGFAEHHR